MNSPSLDVRLPAWQEIMKKLDETRKIKGISVQEISDASGISVSTISRMLAGRTGEPSLYKVAAICEALGVSLDEYLGLSAGAASAEETSSLRRRIIELELNLSNLKTVINGKDKHIEELQQEILHRRHFIYTLIGVTLLMFLLLSYIVIDAINPTWGFFQN